jgi:prepilin-type N-terminal cleavage/methylation domain-containing protein
MKKLKLFTRHYFTLVELLVVITIISILMSLLYPSLISVMEKSRNAVCINNLKTITSGTSIYCDDNNDLYPVRDTSNILNEFKYDHIYTPRSKKYDMREALRPYFGGICGPEFVCPFNKNTRYGDFITGIDQINQNGYGGGNGHKSYLMTYALFPSSNMSGTSNNRLSSQTKIRKNYFPKSNGTLGRIYFNQGKNPDVLFESGIMYADIVKTHSVDALKVPFHLKGSKIIRQYKNKDAIYDLKANYSYTDGSVISKLFIFPLEASEKNDVDTTNNEIGHSQNFLVPNNK